MRPLRGLGSWPHRDQILPVRRWIPPAKQRGGPGDSFVLISSEILRGKALAGVSGWRLRRRRADVSQHWGSLLMEKAPSANSMCKMGSERNSI